MPWETRTQKIWRAWVGVIFGLGALDHLRNRSADCTLLARFVLGNRPRPPRAPALSRPWSGPAVRATCIAAGRPRTARCRAASIARWSCTDCSLSAANLACCAALNGSASSLALVCCDCARVKAMNELSKSCSITASTRAEGSRSGSCSRACAARSASRVVGGWLRRVQRGGDRARSSQQIRAPHFVSSTSPAAALEHQAGLAAEGRGLVLVAAQRGNLLRRVGRAVGEQAMQQEDIEEADVLRRDADRHEGIEVEQPHFDVFDAALAQRMQRPLARDGSRAWAGWCRRTRSRSAAGWWRAGCIPRRGS